MSKREDRSALRLLAEYDAKPPRVMKITGLEVQLSRGRRVFVGATREPGITGKILRFVDDEGGVRRLRISNQAARALSVLLKDSLGGTPDPGGRLRERVKRTYYTYPEGDKRVWTVRLGPPLPDTRQEDR